MLRLKLIPAAPATRPGGRFRAHVAGGDGHSPAQLTRLRRRFDELHAHVGAHQIQQVASPLLLDFGNQVVQRVAQGVEAVVVAEVVEERARTRRPVRNVPVLRIVVLGGNGREVGQFTVPRLVHPAGPLHGVQPVVGRRLDARLDDDLALGQRPHAQRPQFLAGRFVAGAGVFVGKPHRGRDLLILVADPQPEGSLARRVEVLHGVGERQHRLVVDGIVDHRGRIDDGVVPGVRRLVGGDELIILRILGRADVQLIVVEVNVDPVASVLQLPGYVPGNRLRNHRDHLGAEIQLEMDHQVLALVERDAAVVDQRVGQLAKNRDAVQIVRQRLGEADHNLIRSLADADVTVRHHHVVGVSEQVVAAGSNDLDGGGQLLRGHVVERLALVETENQLLRGDMEDFAVFQQGTFVGNDRHQFRTRARRDLTVHRQLPRIEAADVAAGTVPDLQGPETCGRFPPIPRRGESPIVVAPESDRIHVRLGQHRSGSAGRDQHHFQVAHARVRRASPPPTPRSPRRWTARWSTSRRSGCCPEWQR